jgi:hypothetical protein
MVAPNDLKPYDLLKHERLLVSRDTALRLSTALTPGKRAARAAKE